ncbi:Formylglycine-generating enzyme, required for sulfatase activity, contains SUMF1/FGE domain [Nitrosomonas marina]|uniref:Formylglycine-generating enzyme, required for sulfatase activity, contains SUMF1/FGE domain n=1 Tax=Nitrosomonas marina TaxID=917 RepID=A0A1I0F5Z7_9PROT|nr:SUMF1/EgtB/PvdO family nonheme iron enzyme [Nitrosomonas marina]SET52496.1 Formylglycine-generating enzyme, required for sulfatase activity, contains SUMF1/FGE domain [Nitrosomonas marina]
MAHDNKQSRPEARTRKEVFISYSRTDSEACIRLRSELEKAGLNVFRDEDVIRVGDRWVTQLEQALENCNAFVLLVGRNGVQRWVGAEVQIALKRHLSPHDDAMRLPIFPVLLDDANPESLPPFLALFQVDYWKHADPLPDALIEAIKSHVIRTDSRQLFEGCPFLGLSAFEKKDARLFFGRRKETLEALACLGDQQQTNPDSLNQSGGTAYNRWLQIEGNSGSGKSSLVRAGMLPMIEQGALWARTGFDQWTIIGPMMPGKTPLAKLAETLEQGLVDNPAERDSLRRLKRFEDDPRALAFAIKDFKRADTKTAFLLIIDQFEELFTFADEDSRKQFDALLTNALQDPECPLFLINTIRADFLDRFERLPSLQALYNSHCKRFFLPNISEQGMREVIEQRAHLAGLDVSEIMTVMLEDAKNESGVLPLIENALLTLWQHRKGNRLSGDFYRQKNGLAGMLSTQADMLLEKIDKGSAKGKQGALELLLRLTRINDDGRHTRQRVTREEAIYVAGNGNLELGEHILMMLSGGRNADDSIGQQGALRLVTVNQENDQYYVDLIHETLIRARSKDEKNGKLIGYWPTLYNYVEKNHNRELYRQQIKFKSNQWHQSQWLGRLWHLSYSFTDIQNFRTLRLRKNTPEGRFLAWSQRLLLGVVLFWLGVVAFIGDSVYWAKNHDYPLEVELWNPLYRLGYSPLPELVPVPAGTFMMGDEASDKIPVDIKEPFQLGKYEVTYKQYDYYVWTQKRQNIVDIKFPKDAPGGRSSQPVVNVYHHDAAAYAAWLGEQIDHECRLPTEYEWEYAARAGTDTAYYWGDDVGQNNANCAGCGSKWDSQQAAPVGQFKANPFGLHDMLGNVWEWTCSPRNDSLHDGVQQCPELPNNEYFRVLRGGSWFNSPDSMRASNRDDFRPGGRSFNIGFRVLCSSPIE